MITNKAFRGFLVRRRFDMFLGELLLESGVIKDLSYINEALGLQKVKGVKLGTALGSLAEWRQLAQA